MLLESGHEAGRPLLLPCHTQEMSSPCQETLSACGLLPTWLPDWYLKNWSGREAPAPGLKQGRSRLSGTITGLGSTAASWGALVPGDVRIKGGSGNSPATTARSLWWGKLFPILLTSLIGKCSPTSSRASSKCLLAPAALKMHHSPHPRHHPCHCHRHGNPLPWALLVL